MARRYSFDFKIVSMSPIFKIFGFLIILCILLPSFASKLCPPYSIDDFSIEKSDQYMPKDQEPSPYATALWDKLSFAGLEKVFFNTSFPQKDLKAMIYLAPLFYIGRFKVSFPPEYNKLLKYMSDVGAEKFANTEITPFKWYKTFIQPMEEYLLNQEILTSQNYEELAQKHFENLEGIYNEVPPLDNAFLAVLAQMTGNTRFLNSLSEIPLNCAVRMLIIWLHIFLQL